MIEPLFLFSASTIFGALFFIPAQYSIIAFSVSTLLLAFIGSWCYAKTFSSNIFQTFLLGVVITLLSAINILFLGDEIIIKGSVQNFILIVFAGFILTFIIQLIKKSPRENLVKGLLVDMFQVFFTLSFAFIYMLAKLFNGNYAGFIMSFLFAYILQSLCGAIISIIKNIRRDDHISQKTQIYLLCITGVIGVVFANEFLAKFWHFFIVRNNDLIFLILVVILATIFANNYSLPLIMPKVIKTENKPKYLLTHPYVQIFRATSIFVYGFIISYFIAILVQF